MHVNMRVGNTEPYMPVCKRKGQQFVVQFK